MRVLMISSDRKLFEPESEVWQRVIEYGNSFGEIRIIVFSKKSNGFNNVQISEKVWVYPTNSKIKFGYILDAIKIGYSILSELYFGETVITAQDIFCGLAGYRLKKKFNLPLQVQIHTDLFNPFFYKFSLLNFCQFVLSRYLLRRADGIRVVREKIALDLIKKIKFSKEKIVVLPIFNNVETKVVQNENRKNILVVSRLEKEKGIDIAIDVFAQVKKQLPEINLTIVGSGSQEKALRKKAKDSKLEGSIVFKGWQNNIKNYFTEAQVYLHTSFYEGFGLSLLEAAQFGCPIVTTDVGLAQDLFEDGRSAMICKINDINCLSNKLTNVLMNISMGRNLSYNATQAIQKVIISRRDYIERYKNSLESLLINK